MYLWRNLPQGQLSAVLAWLYGRRQPSARPLPRPAGEPRTPATADTPAQD